MSGVLVFGIAAAYLYLLFAVAFYIDKRARRAGAPISSAITLNHDRTWPPIGASLSSVKGCGAHP